MKVIQFYLKPNNALLTGFCYERDVALPESDARPAVLIFGGGAYKHIIAKERDPIAMAYLHYGFNAFVLHYSVTESSEGSPMVSEQEVMEKSLEDAQSALSYLKEHALELNVDPNRIAVVGFSAGGNLALRLGVLSNCKPNALVLGYPAVETVTGLKEEEKILDNINQETPPTFLFHTEYDSMVSPVNSLKLALRLAEEKIPFETHIFPTGDHGLALGIENTGDCNRDVAKWHKMSVRFLQNIFSGKNLLWGDLVDQKVSIDTRDDILYHNKKAKQVLEKYIPQFVDQLIANPFFAYIPLRRFALLMGIENAVLVKMDEELKQL